MLALWLRRSERTSTQRRVKRRVRDDDGHLVEVDPATDEKVWEMIIRDEVNEGVNTRGYRAERLSSLYPPE